MKNFISHIDHIVMTCTNVQKTAEFYHQVLGLDVITFGENNARYALQFGNQKVNLHQYGSEIKPHADSPTPGSIDICLITETPLNDMVTHLTNHGINIESGPVSRTGAVGKITSIYFRDLDNNLIEVSNY